jgi:UDP-N-acetylglucosamine--N-acetylmuramyl-(pentapeptide) pyrophosphoryl-undecaprenol N-acetylglucosamine transferase
VELDDEPNDLWNKVESLLYDSERLEKMGEAAKSLGMPDAADQIAKIIMDMERT